MEKETIDPEKDVIDVKANEQKPCDRITALLGFHLQHCGDSTYSADIRFSAFAKDEGVQPYHRRLIVPDRPTSLDLGWFKDDPAQIGYVIIENRVGRELTAHAVPTAEARGKAADQELWICGIFSVLPGQFFASRVIGSSELEFFMEAADEPVPINLWIFPR